MSSGLFQNSLYVGINLQNVLYGIELVLYFKSMHYLLAHNEARTKPDIFYAIFSSVLLLMATIWVLAQTTFCGTLWLLEANFPGGADAYWQANIGVWYMAVATVTVIILQLTTDALMIFRCWVVWNSRRVVIVPLILWAVTLSLVCWTLNAYNGGLYFHDISAQLGLAYYCVSVLLTVMLTCMICYRLLRHGRIVKERLEDEYASPYFAVVALVVESVLPLTLSGVVFLISLGLGSQTSSAVGYVYVLLMCVSPQMLILRVAMKREWTPGSSRPRHSTIEFSPQERVALGVSKGSACEVLDVQTLGSIRGRNSSMV